MRTFESLDGSGCFCFCFEGDKKNMPRLTRAQLVEEGIAQGNHGGEVFDPLELHHVGAGPWARQDPQLGQVIPVSNPNGEHRHS